MVRADRRRPSRELTKRAVQGLLGLRNFPRYCDMYSLRTVASDMLIGISRPRVFRLAPSLLRSLLTSFGCLIRIVGDGPRSTSVNSISTASPRLESVSIMTRNRQ
ncbi:hypothetical protein D3C77_717790 [compost metagenome]